MNALELIDGLKERGILDRLESCECDGERVLLKLSPPTRATAETMPPKARERDEDDEQGLKYASS